MRPALILLFAAAAAAASPLDAVDAEWKAKGYAVRERLSGSNGGLKASAALYSPEKGGGDRLEIRVLVKNRAYLGYSHPSALERLEFDPSPAGRFIDMFHDGSLALAYRATRASVGSTELNVLRWKRFKIERVATFSEGRFVRFDGGTLIAARELPLGRYLSVSCEDFITISRTAFKTTLNAPRRGGFVNVSSEHPGFYETEIARKEAELARLKGALQKNAGEYLGLSISTYYDYEASGRARKGWERLHEFFRIPPSAPAAVKTCMSSMEKDLRGKLAVPADWP